jgi:peptidoglycan/LPS O-acetylase OafA/YrhL
LITNILLTCRFQIEDEPDHRNAGFMLRQFYVRRFLRIFPAYYALLLAIGLFAMTRPTGSAWVESFKFHATYTSNFWFGLNNSFVPLGTAHFWSLAVEEQFYLFWPVIMLWLPRKWLWSAVILLIVSAPAFRCAMFFLGNGMAGYVLTPACLDALGLGALLALGGNLPRYQAAIRLVGLISFVLIGVSLVLPFDSDLWTTYVRHGLIDTMWALAFVALVSKASEGFTGPMGAVFTFTPIRYLGRISYGLYLYHLPIIVVVAAVLEQLGLSTRGLICFVVSGSISLAIAALSWHRFEEPLNRLKHLFPYSTAKRAVAVSCPTAATAPTS